MNILEAYTAYGYTPIRRGSSQYAGPCPFCPDHGEDRFVINLKGFTPDGLFFCRHCGISGGTTNKFNKYVNFIKNGVMCEDLSASSNVTKYFSKSIHPVTPFSRKTRKLPEPITCSSYLEVIDKSIKRITIFPYAAKYLNARGINKDTIQHFKLGYSCGIKYYPITDNPDGRYAWSPYGICIPNYRGDNLYCIRVRLFDDNNYKYMVLPGCHPIPFIAYGSDRKNLPVLIVESDFDAMLLWQENRDRFHAYIALGSASVQPTDPEVLSVISSSPKVYFIADNDDAGIKAYDTWHAYDDKIQLALLPQGKDPTEAWQMGVDLGSWCKKLRTCGVSEPPKEPELTKLALSSHEDLVAYLASAEHTVAMDYDPTSDELSFSDGSTDAAGVASNIAVDWDNDFVGHELICYDPAIIHRDLPSCSIKLESLLYLYHALTGKGHGASLKSLSVQHFGCRNTDLSKVVKLYQIYKPQLDANLSAEKPNSSRSNYYIILRGSQLAIGQMMHHGILLDVEKYKSIETKSKLDFSTFAGEDGRVRGHISLMDAVTGRLSCRTPPLYSVPNQQKAAFVPAEGNVFVDADYKSCELRIAAHLSGDKTLLDLLTSGADIHRAVMQLVLAREEITDEERKAGKVINIGFIYGQTSTGLQQRLQELGITINTDSARELYLRYKLMFDQLSRWISDRQSELGRAKDEFFVRTAIHRSIPLLPFGIEWLPKVANYIIQGTGAEVLLYALSVLPKKLEGLDAKILLSIHDEILLEVPESNAQAAADALVEAMTEAFGAVLKTDKLDHLVEVHIGRSWLEAKEGA